LFRTPDTGAGCPFVIRGLYFNFCNGALFIAPQMKAARGWLLLSAELFYAQVAALNAIK